MGSVVMDQLSRLRAALAYRYDLDREIGRGGMATVYLAHDKHYDRTVAIKVLRPEVGAALGSERFLREIQIEARLQHPHILPLYDSAAADGLLYYVMPYEEGESLRERIRREKQLPVDDALRIAREVADALEYAHQHGVVHRDIKPGNILLSGGHAIVADFGIAKAVSAVDPEGMTESGIAVGTPEYMSPEQASGDAHADSRTDVYALGCVLYEMLAGEPPFTGRTVQAVLARHRYDSPHPLSVVRPNLAPEVQQAVERALAKIPADRFPTAAAFAASLSPGLATAERPAPRPWRSRAIRTAVLLGGLSMAAVAAILRPGLTGHPPADAQRDPTHIAVLYFDAERPTDAEMRSVANGLTEDLIDQLGQVEALSVISANGVRPFRDRPAPVDSIASALSVGTIVTGTVTGSAEHPRATVRLIDAATGRQIVSTSLAPARGDLLSLRADLALEVSRFLRERLGKELSLRELSAGTRNSRAWVLLRRAQGLRDDARTLYAAGDTSVAHRTLDTADSLLGAAERQAPTWLDPIVLRGWIAADRIDLAEGKTALSVAQWASPGIAHAERALARKGDYAPALELRGYLRFMRWDNSKRAPPGELEAAERDLRAGAVPENPSQARAWSSLSLLLQRKGSIAEANLAAQRAYQADAFLTAAPAVVYRLFFTSVMLRRWREAGDWCAQGYDRFPGDWLFSLCRLVLLYEPSGQRPDGAHAWRLVQEMERVAPPSERAVLANQWRMLAATVLARAGLHDSARSTIRAARSAGGGDPELDFYEAGVRVLLGEHEQAVRLLERYIARTPAGVIAHVKRDPLFDALQGDPRFQALIAESH